jgi:hypothetical protein
MRTSPPLLNFVGSLPSCGTYIDTSTRPALLQFLLCLAPEQLGKLPGKMYTGAAGIRAN